MQLYQKNALPSVLTMCKTELANNKETNSSTTSLQHSCNEIYLLFKLEQLERLRSEDTPRRLMITHTIESYWIPSQKMTKSKLQILKIRQNF